jgi:hypothetical protein
MTWTAEHQRAADRRGLRYPSDLTQGEARAGQGCMVPLACGALQHC